MSDYTIEPRYREAGPQPLQGGTPLPSGHIYVLYKDDEPISVHDTEGDAEAWAAYWRDRDDAPSITSLDRARRFVERSEAA